MNILRRNNVQIKGKGPQALVFAHGFGCDQNMWRYITPAFEENFQAVLFDHVGSGRSDLSSYNKSKYSSLRGYAGDVVDLIEELELKRPIFVGHSVSAMIGILAAIDRPELFDKLILVGPSPCYINDGEYIGGFTREQIEGLIESLEANYFGWSAAMAPVIMGNSEQPALGEELTNSFCRTDPEIAKQFARVTFFSDNRADLSKLSIPSLILQCSQDVIAPIAVGEYLKQNLKKSELRIMKATGHCPNLSAPEETISLIQEYLNRNS
jgi:sigma-B regulation protein RsbQ